MIVTCAYEVLACWNPCILVGVFSSYGTESQPIGYLGYNAIGYNAIGYNANFSKGGLSQTTVWSKNRTLEGRPKYV